jgi:superfamily I DNA/RNA helicase
MDQGASPYEVPAVTFTNKAASEMKHRVSSCIGEETAKKLGISRASLYRKLPKQ